MNDPKIKHLKVSFFTSDSGRDSISSNSSLSLVAAATSFCLLLCSVSDFTGYILLIVDFSNFESRFAFMFKLGPSV